MSMKREITISFAVKTKKEAVKPSVEDVTVYGKGAGLYSYLNTLAQTLAAPKRNEPPFRIHQ